MALRNRIAALLLTAMSLACATEVPPTQAPTVSPSASVSAPLATVARDPVPTPSATARSTPALAERKRSDLFWDAAISGEQPDTIASLRRAVARSDLIVVGRLSDDRSGEYLRGFPSRVGFVIDELFKGEPQSPEAGTIILQLSLTLSDLAPSEVPRHAHVLFLHYLPWELERMGRSLDEQDDNTFLYGLENGTQAVIRELDGVVRVLDPRNPDRFPNWFEGEDFDLLLDRVRRVVAAESR